MDFADFFFPSTPYQQAQNLKGLSRRQAKEIQRSRKRRGRARREREALENDVGYLSLVLGALLMKLDEKGLVTPDEIQATLGELDGLDGVVDGKLDIDVFRGLYSDDSE